MDVPTRMMDILLIFWQTLAMHHELQFFFQADIRKILDHFSRLLGVRFCFLSPSGSELQVGEDKPHNPFCRLIRDRLHLTQKCQDCDRQGWRRATKLKRAVSYHCHAGMTDGCMAVRMEGRIIGYMMIGQFRQRATCSPDVRRAWKQAYGNDTLQAVFAKVPYYTARQTQDIMGVFAVLVDFVLAQRLISIRGQDSIQPLLAYLADHPQETLSTPRAARLLNRSVSSFCRDFKKAVGIGFLQYQLAAKLDRADALFQKKENITVREVAFDLGFNDPYYFSRIYRTHRGHSPRHVHPRTS